MRETERCGVQESAWERQRDGEFMRVHERDREFKRVRERDREMGTSKECVREKKRWEVQDSA